MLQSAPNDYIVIFEHKEHVFILILVKLNLCYVLSIDNPPSSFLFEFLVQISFKGYINEFFAYKFTEILFNSLL